MYMRCPYNKHMVCSYSNHIRQRNYTFNDTSRRRQSRRSIISLTITKTIQPVRHIRIEFIERARRSLFGLVSLCRFYTCVSFCGSRTVAKPVIARSWAKANSRLASGYAAGFYMYMVWIWMGLRQPHRNVLAHL